MDELGSGDEFADANMCSDFSDDEIAQGIGQVQSDGVVHQSRATAAFRLNRDGKVKKRDVENNSKHAPEVVPNLQR